jgi:hypothetical protein
MAFRQYNQNFILASSSRLMDILFMSKRNDHPVVRETQQLPKVYHGRWFHPNDIQNLVIS